MTKPVHSTLDTDKHQKNNNIFSFAQDPARVSDEGCFQKHSDPLRNRRALNIYEVKS